MSKSKEPETLGELSKQTGGDSNDIRVKFDKIFWELKTFGELKDLTKMECKAYVLNGLSPNANIIEQVAFYTKKAFTSSWIIIENIIWDYIKIKSTSREQHEEARPYNTDTHNAEMAAYMDTHYTKMVFNSYYALKWFREKLHSLLSYQKPVSFGEKPSDIWPKRKYQYSNLSPAHFPKYFNGFFSSPSGYASALSVAEDFFTRVYEVLDDPLTLMPTAIDDDKLKDHLIAEEIKDIDLGYFNAMASFSLFAPFSEEEKIFSISEADEIEKKGHLFMQEILSDIDIEHQQAQANYRGLLARQAATPGEAQGETISEDDWITQKLAAELLEVTTGRVTHLCDEGKLHSFGEHKGKRISKKSVYIFKGTKEYQDLLKDKIEIKTDSRKLNRSRD